MGENFETIMEGYFEDLKKKKMKNKFKISKSVVDKYYDHICFLVDADYTYGEVVIPRVAWPRPLYYEVNIDEVLVTITTLIDKEIDKNIEPFGNMKHLRSK